VTLPVLVSQSSTDAVFTKEHGIAPSSPTLVAWRQGLERSFTDVRWLHSGTALDHVSSTTDLGLTRGPAGSTLADILRRFWSDGPPERVVF
jgi:hypothetical protein